MNKTGGVGHIACNAVNYSPAGNLTNTQETRELSGSHRPVRTDRKYLQSETLHMFTW